MKLAASSKGYVPGGVRSKVVVHRKIKRTRSAREDTSIYVYVCMYVYLSVYLYACGVCDYVCMDVCMYVW